MNPTTFDFGFAVVGYRNGLEVIVNQRIANESPNREGVSDVLISLMKLDFWIDKQDVIYGFSRYRHASGARFVFYTVYLYVQDAAGRNGYIAGSLIVRNQRLRTQDAIDYVQKIKEYLQGYIENNRIVGSSFQVHEATDRMMEFIYERKKQNEYLPEGLSFREARDSRGVFCPAEQTDETEWLTTFYERLHDHDFSNYRTYFTARQVSQAMSRSFDSARLITFKQNEWNLPENTNYHNTATEEENNTQKQPWWKFW
jgi:hypothetical protein